MPSDPFGDLRRVLNQPETANAITGARLDHGRRTRTGIPEIVYAPGKTTAEVISSLEALAARAGRAIASKCEQAIANEVVSALSADYSVDLKPTAAMIIVAKPTCDITPTGGKVGVLTAGTSDSRVAAEASIIAQEMGCTVVEALDVGVAGIHRLVEPLERCAVEGVDVLVVCAGMDGVLPSVVSGLVDVPVIGVPVSTGYGFGGEGLGALTTMLQSCAPGLVVVNIDNGIGAGATAALIANRCASARSTG